MYSRTINFIKKDFRKQKQGLKNKKEPITFWAHLIKIFIDYPILVEHSFVEQRLKWHAYIPAAAFPLIQKVR